MKSIRKVPVFEQLEQKLPLAADAFEQVPFDAPSAMEPAPIAAAQVDVASTSFGASAGPQSALSTDEVQALNGEDDDDGEDGDDDNATVFTTNLAGTAPGSGTAEFQSEMEDGITESDLTIVVTGTTPGTHAVALGTTSLGNIVVGADGSGRLELSSDPDEEETMLPAGVTSVAGMNVTVTVGTSSLTGMFSTAPDVDDDEEEDDEDGDDGAGETDDNDSDDEETDDDETVLTANLTGTGSGTARFASEMEDGSTERDLTIEVTGTTPGTHAVKIGTITVGNIVVGADGTGILELSSDPDEEETMLPDTVTSVEGMTVMVGTVLMGTFPTSAAAMTSTLAQSPDTTANSLLLLAASSSASSRQALQGGNGFEPALAQPIVIDATAVDMLLAIIGNDELNEPESTEFVGRSDQRDAASEVLEVAYEAEEGDFESPEEPSDRS